MSGRVDVRPAVMDWALRRSRMKPSDKRYPRFSEWASGHEQPTFKQLENFARATHAPLGYLFLDVPPVEAVPIPDYRTLGNAGVAVPSPDLLDTIYECQRRQEWFKAFTTEQGYSPLPFIGSVSLSNSVVTVADLIRNEIGFGMAKRTRFTSWGDALRQLIDMIEDIGVLVMVSGITGSNTRRKLDPKEFRGFALSDPMAPLIFVNGADSKSAQMFTLVHELAHLWLGETALSDASMSTTSSNTHEVWANRVAAEVLVPTSALSNAYAGSAAPPELDRLARVFKVSTLVILKRIFDAGFLKWEDYRDRYVDEEVRVLSIIEARSGSGGNYYNTQPLRVSRTFARAVIIDTMEGNTLYRDAFGLLGAAKKETFDGLASTLGVA